ncbi:MAG TPA: hypothetical protein VKQ30_13540 [Ktedonobacterales bacterium]|nr:hypothetical protein [Ktedonobacterales bacterium]
MAAAKKSSQRRASRPRRADAPLEAPVAAAPRTLTAATRRHTRPLANPPAAAPCADLETLQALAPEAARDHVAAYLRDVMSPDEADAFEASNYRWDLHLVAIDEVCLVRGIELDTAKLRRYRRALARSTRFPALVGLGGDSSDVTRGVLLCDGYHRAVAMRDAGIHYVWAWLATDIWRAAPASVPALSR